MTDTIHQKRYPHPKIDPSKFMLQPSRQFKTKLQCRTDNQRSSRQVGKERDHLKQRIDVWCNILLLIEQIALRNVPWQMPEFGVGH